MSFKDVLDQERAVSFLRSAIHRDRLPHAMLFSGPSGSGQIETALALTQTVFCRRRKGEEACNECSDCRLVMNRTHPDLVWLEPEKDSRVIKVEEIRGLISRSNLKPLQAASKMFVIDRADCLNDAAQNALLKTLEEPEGGYFVLISYAMEKILPTVRSRAQLINFIPAAGNEEAAKGALSAARIAVFQYCSVPSPVRSAPPEMGGLSREEVLWVLEAAIEDLRESLLIGAGAGSLLGAIDQRPRKESAAEALGTEKLMDRLETLAEYKDMIARSVNTKLTLAVLWEKI